MTQDLDAQMREVLRKLEVIELAVAGDTKHGIEGIAKRLDRNEGEIASIKAWRSKFTLRMAYTVGIVNGIVFGGIEGVTKILQSISHTKP